MPKLIARIFALLLFGFNSCNPGANKTPNSTNKSTLMPVSYARGFKIEIFSNYKKLTVLSPWQNSQGISFEYYLVPQNKEIPDELTGKEIIRTPVKKVICLSTSHVGFLSVLNVTNSIKGISGPGFVLDTTVQKAINNKSIIDVGYDTGLNYEIILGLTPDLIMAYSIGGEITGTINKLKDLNLNVVLIGEYLEESPLAKAEWIKFVGALYNKEKEAFEYFGWIENNYNAAKKNVSKVKFRPLVLTGLPFKDAWWMAGGKSNLARLIADAGGEYLWKDNQSKDAFVVSIEDVIMRAAKAEYWINCGNVNSISELLATDSRFNAFPQVTKKTIYNNNLVVSKGGGNDYWERGVVRPDLILSDLVKIFHPEIEGGQTFNFYKKIE
jgi:iron complex transport system substrate-binding protein